MPDTPRADSNITDTFNALAGAMRPLAQAYVEQVRRTMETLRPLVEWAKQHPEELARWELERQQEDDARGCHCLCGTHRAVAEGICIGSAELGLTVRFDSPTVGTQHVPMCRPCRDARMVIA